MTTLRLYNISEHYPRHLIVLDRTYVLTANKMLGGLA